MDQGIALSPNDSLVTAALAPGGPAEWRAHWPTVLAAMIGLSLTTVYVYSSGALLLPIQHDTGWSRTQIMAGLTVASVFSAIVGPFVGAAVDRYGARTLAIPGVIIFGCGLALLASARSPHWWLLLWGLLGIASAGVKPTIWASAVSSLFAKSRGLALAVTLSGAGVGSALAPLLTNALVKAVGWRLTYVFLALIWGGITFLVVALFFRSARDKPAAMVPTAAVLEDDGRSAWVAIRSRAYMFILIASTECALVQMALVISLIPLLGDRGIAPAAAAGIAATVGFTSIAGRLASGAMMDRASPRVISAISLALPAAACAAFLIGGKSIAIAVVAVSLLGLSIGAELEAATYLTSRYFGLRHFGLLFGIIASALTIATGAGPLIASYIYDRTGSYQLLFVLVIPLSLAASALIAALGPPPAVAIQP